MTMFGDSSNNRKDQKRIKHSFKKLMHMFPLSSRERVVRLIWSYHLNFAADCLFSFGKESESRNWFGNKYGYNYVSEYVNTFHNILRVVGWVTVLQVVFVFCLELWHLEIHGGIFPYLSNLRCTWAFVSICNFNVPFRHKKWHGWLSI